MKKLYLIYDKKEKQYLCMWFEDIQAADSYAIRCCIKEYKNFNILKVITLLTIFILFLLHYDLCYTPQCI